MKYFAKYLPLVGEVEVGGKYWNRQWLCADYVGNELHKEILDKGGFNPVELFLCTNDIKVGEKVCQYHPDKRVAQPLYPKAEYILQKGDIEKYKEIGISKDVFKVVGIISPEAKWVKEGDEFEENDIHLIWVPKDRPHPVHYSGIVSNGPMHSPEYYTELVRIKGPCGHFH